MFWAMASFAFGPLARLCMGFLGPTSYLPGASWRDRHLRAGPMCEPGAQVRVAVYGSVHRRAGEDADGRYGDEDRPAGQD